LLGNPTLKKTSDVKIKTRFKMWWRLIGSAVEHGARLVKEDSAVERETMDRETREKMDALAAEDVDFKSMFLSQEDDDDDSASLADALTVMKRQWLMNFKAGDIADLINKREIDQDESVESFREKIRDGVVLRDFLFSNIGHVPAGFLATPKSVGKRLQAHIDEPVRHGGSILVLRGEKNRDDVVIYFVKDITETGDSGQTTVIKPQRSAPSFNAGSMEMPLAADKTQQGLFGSPLDYWGPVVEVPDLGPDDDLDKHGVPKNRR
jgi:hypothetical protein